MEGSPRPVEFFLTSHWLTDQALQRRQEMESPALGRTVPLPTPADFLLLKAAYWLQESRPRAKAVQDGVDLEEVIIRHRDALDLDYLEENARKLDLWSKLPDLLDL